MKTGTSPTIVENIFFLKSQVFNIYDPGIVSMSVFECVSISFELMKNLAETEILCVRAYVVILSKVLPGSVLNHTLQMVLVYLCDSLIILAALLQI